MECNILCFKKQIKMCFKRESTTKNIRFSKENVNKECGVWWLAVVTGANQVGLHSVSIHTRCVIWGNLLYLIFF